MSKINDLTVGELKKLLEAQIEGFLKEQELLSELDEWGDAEEQRYAISMGALLAFTEALRVICDTEYVLTTVQETNVDLTTALLRSLFPSSDPNVTIN